MDAGLLRYTPAADFNGDTQLSYTVSDGKGNQVVVSVAVTVTPLNDAPQASGDAYAVRLGQSLVVSAANGVLANDRDVERDVLRVIGFDDPANGTLQLETDGSFTYVPDAGFRGLDTIEYTVSDGVATSTAQLSITVQEPINTVELEAGADARINEGATFTRSISFSDGEDNGAAGWVYSIDYGDGSTIVTGNTTVHSLSLDHQYVDGSASRTVSVSVTDVAGETVSDSFVVTVDNLAPTAAVSGAATVAEGSLYTLSVGPITDPGADTRSLYTIAWGDGSTDSFTSAEWTAAAGSFTHTYADGPRNTTITLLSVARRKSRMVLRGASCLSICRVNCGDRGDSSLKITRPFKPVE